MMILVGLSDILWELVSCLRLSRKRFCRENIIFSHVTLDDFIFSPVTFDLFNFSPQCVNFSHVLGGFF